MSTFEDQWFEVWFSQGENLRPTWLYVVAPNTSRPGYVLVYDPQQNYSVVYDDLNYEDTCQELRMDGYYLVEGRMFPDDGWEVGDKRSA